MIHEGPGAYSNMVRLPDGNVGLLVEIGESSPYEQSALSRLTSIGWKIECESTERVRGQSSNIKLNYVYETE